MKNLFFAFALSLSLASVSSASDSKITPMEGVNVVCSNEGGFFAFNFAAQRIWFGDRYEKAQKAFELDSVKMAGIPKLFKFVSTLQITWGNQIYFNKVSGAVTFRSPNSQAVITMSAMTGGESKTQTLHCH